MATCITLGNVRNVNDLIEQCKANDVSLGLSAEDLIGSKILLREKVEFELDAVLVSEMKFDKAPTIDQIFAWAKENNLDICPPETAFLFWLQHPLGFPKGTSAYIAMEPIMDSDDFRKIYRVVHNIYGRWVDVSWSHKPIRSWTPETLWIFRKIE